MNGSTVRGAPAPFYCSLSVNSTAVRPRSAAWRWSTLERQPLRPAIDVFSAPDGAAAETCCWLWKIGPLAPSPRGVVGDAADHRDLLQPDQFILRHASRLTRAATSTYSVDSIYVTCVP